jgi:hypothetical protein
MKWPIGGRRLTRDGREEILRVYMNDPDAGTRLAVSKGLAPTYAYKLANSRGLLPLTRWSKVKTQ